MIKDIKRNLLPMSATLKDVLTVLNKGVFGVVFVVDENGVMQGLFTDGDVRRALLKDASLAESVIDYMNRNFVAGSSRLSRSENISLLTEKIRHLPILDEDNRPVDVISWAEIWRLPVMEPSLGGNELKYVADCITSNWISSQGHYVRKFEQVFAEYIKTDHALTCSNGTTALHLALLAVGIRPGDEVIIPDFTFASPANTTIHCGGIPVFADVDKYTWTLDPDDIEHRITERTRAIIPVHIYGHPCDMDPILEIAARYDLFVIEDCAEALGAEYKGRMVGSMGHIGTYSFFANKVITTGEGGMVTTNDPVLNTRMSMWRDHGMRKEKRYWHEYAGFNYRMTNLQAAVGLAQMEQIHGFLSYREEVVKRYNEQLAQINGITRPPKSGWAKNIYWLYSILIDEDALGTTRDELALHLADYGIETRPFFYPLHVQPPYQPQPPDGFPITSWLSSHGLSLPTANDIQLEDVDRVCTTINRVVNNIRTLNNHLLSY